MGMKLEIEVVLGSDGKMDKAATLRAAGGFLDKWAAQRELEEGQIATAFDKVFDRLKGVKVNSRYVIGQVLNELNVQPENQSVLETKVTAYLRANSQGKIVDKAKKLVTRPDSKFVITKGKGTDGTYRRSDGPPKGVSADAETGGSEDESDETETAE